MQFIASSQNKIFKNTVQLDKKRNREKQHLFLIEGFREFALSQKAGYAPEWIVLNSKGAESAEWKHLEPQIHVPVYLFSDELFERIAYRDRVANILVASRLTLRKFSDLDWTRIKRVVVLEGVEKPGNLGAIFRTCDAAGVDVVFISEPRTDTFHPNVVRASLGSLFTVPFVICRNQELFDILKEKGIGIYTTWLEGSVPHFNTDLSSASAIVLGSEAHGVSKFWVEHADQCIKIPMYGEVDSMNVSTAAAVMIYEMLRQQEVADHCPDQSSKL